MNHILFPVTYKCNLSCKFCCAKSTAEVDTDRCLDTIKDKAKEVPWVYVTGGEPFILGDKLFDIVDKLKGYGFKTGVTTNGTFFVPEIAEHIDRLGVSLDGDEEYHDAYRGAGVFKSAVKLLEATKGKCETVVMSVVFKGNEEALKKLKPVVEKIDPTYWQLQRDQYDPTVLVLEIENI